jgi:N-acetylglutamate synthase-like GNAT family acetyltransferase
MTAGSYRARRATLDDLDTLKALWSSMRFDVQDLEPRFTEFQVAEDSGGTLAGAVGFQIAGRHGRIHSEAFADFSIADQVRPTLWNRIQSLCRNHGVLRLWTQETAPFWSRSGLQPATADGLEKLPAAWNRAAPGWLTLQLKDEDSIASIEKEFAMFVQSEKRRTAESINKARTVKNILAGIAFLIAIALTAAAIYLVFTRRSPGMLTP